MKRSTKKNNGQITSMAELCKDYVLYDEELMANPKIKKHINNDVFWREIGQICQSKVRDYLESQSEDENEYDDVDDYGLSDKTVIAFAINPENRFDVNDLILDSIEDWLLHFGQMKSSR